MYDDRTTQPEDAHPAGLAANVHIRNDEELMLLASRRKLLARSDWLALEPTRPLRLNFPATSNNERVGRRKKIKRAPAQASKPAQQRLLTPLFEERLQANDYMMSGALPPSSDGKIEIKVGTDAFDSQTCPTRKSQVSRNASVCSQSTALSRLSEESMLLGPDGDTFDANLVEVQPFHARYDESVEPPDHREHMPLYGVGRSTQATRGHSPAYSNQTALQQLAVSSFSDHSMLTAEHSLRIDLQDEDTLADTPCDAPQPREVKPAGGIDASTKAPELSSSHPVTSPDQNDPDSEAENAWRRLMGIATQVASSASIKALNSMSEHVTASESPCTANPIRVGIFDMAASSPRSEGPNPSEHGSEHGLEHGSENNDFPLVVGSHHPAEPPVATAQLPQPSHIIPEDDHGESLWRDFVIGSQDSESEDELQLAWQRKRKRKRRPSNSEQSRSLQLSGLGTSDKATQGGTVALSSPSFVHIELDESDLLHDRSEGIEGLSPNFAAESKGTQNIHASSPMRWLSKKPKRRGTDGHG
jgi:hypothetical protein